MQNVSIVIAFLAGLISFLSPCILPMVPAYIMYLSGTFDEEDIKNQNLKAFRRTLFFVLGFSVVFIFMGASATFLGKILIENKVILRQISGFMIITLGLNMLGVFKLNFLNKDRHFNHKFKNIGNLKAFAVGIFFAAGWSPCFGSILGSIVFYASFSQTMAKGIVLLSVYALGMAVPFLLASLFLDKLMNFERKNSKLIEKISKLGSIFMILFGILIFSGVMNQVSLFIIKFYKIFNINI